MKYTSQDILSILDGKLLNKTLVSNELKLVSYDTRKLIFAPKSLFFALKGAKNNGHNFIDKAYELGVRNFVISKNIEHRADANYFLVEDTLKALQQLATYHRQQYSLKVIAITGSYGKTIVKDWLYDGLKDQYAVVKSPKSYNSQIGVPISLLQIQKHHDIALIEAGISQSGEMEALEKMIQPQIGVFTNIGVAHSKGFANETEKLNEKLSLFKSTETIIGLKEYEDRVTNQITTIPYYRGIKEYSTTFKDQIHQKNAGLVASVLEYLDYSKNSIESILNNLRPINMRLEIIKGPADSLLINDAYIADLPSLEIALNTLVQQAANRLKWLIISDFDIASEEEHLIYSKVNELLAAFEIEKVWVVGSKLPTYLTNKELRSFPKKEELISSLKKYALDNQAILIKGARKYALETIAQQISTQVHDTRLEINLSALKHNLNIYSSFLKESTEIIGVLKAGAYGSGGPEIGQILLQNGVKYLAVAFTAEAIELRKAGIKAPIIILNSQIVADQSWIDYDLEPIVYSLEQLDSILKMIEQSDKKLLLHLNLNTGMNRLGLETEEIPIALNKIQGKALKIASVFTHLSSSEDPEQDDYSEEQILKFQKNSETILSSFDYPIKQHVLNTTGIARFSKYQMDAVRLGLGMYGIDLSNSKLDVQKVHSLTSKIIQIKSYKETSSIGYNRKHKTSKDEIIATIPIGYADGLPRKAGNGKYSVLVNNKKAPIIGNVCMDLIMIDVTHIPKARVGDQVIIFNDQLPIEKLSNVCNTIPYEILSNISPRVHRILIEE